MNAPLQYVIANMIISGTIWPDLNPQALYSLTRADVPPSKAPKLALRANPVNETSTTLPNGNRHPTARMANRS